jgi:hypothetical protein
MAAGDWLVAAWKLIEKESINLPGKTGLKLLCLYRIWYTCVGIDYEKASLAWF